MPDVRRNWPPAARTTTCCSTGSAMPGEGHCLVAAEHPDGTHAMAFPSWEACEATRDGVMSPIDGFRSYHAIFLRGSTSGSFAAVPSALYPNGGSFSVQWQ